MIRFGDIEYFTLLELRDRLKARQWDKLDLLNIDRLRNEVEIKIQQIHLQEEEYQKNNHLK